MLDSHPLSEFSCYFRATALLTSCTTSKSNLYLHSSLETVIREPALYEYKVLAFHVPNLISIFCRLGRLSKESVRVRGSYEHFITSLFFYDEGLLFPRPRNQLEDYPFSAVGCFLLSVLAVIIHS
jgi:hypothetical protein